MEKQVKINNDLYVLTTEAYEIETEANRIFIPEDSFMAFAALNEGKENLYKYNYNAYSIKQEPLKGYFEDMHNHYFTIEALGSGDMTITLPAAITTDYVTSISYSVNDGDWVDIENTDSAITETIEGINKGDTIKLKGEAVAYATSTVSASTIDTDSVRILPDFNFNLKGNIMSLLYGDDFRGQTELTGQYTFAMLFFQNTNLIHVKDLVLPATTLTTCCYKAMFEEATNLEDGIKELPARNVPQEAYRRMFAKSKVKYGVKLDCDVIGSNACYSMYYNSTLETMPTIKVGTVKQGALMYVCGGTKLKESPKVFIDLVEQKWGAGYMFWQCYDLETANDITIGEIRGEEGCARIFQKCNSLKKGANFAIDKITSKHALYVCYYQAENLEYPGNFTKPMIVTGEEALTSMFYENFKLRETMPLIGHTLTGLKCCYLMYHFSYQSMEICRTISVKETGDRTFSNYICNVIWTNNGKSAEYRYPETKLKIIEPIKIQKLNGTCTFIQAFAGNNYLEKGPTITIDNIVDIDTEANFFYAFFWCKGMKEGCKFTKKFPFHLEEFAEMYAGNEQLSKIWIPTSTDLSATRCVYGLFVSNSGFGRVANSGTVYIKAGVTIPSNANMPETWTVVEE